MKGDVFPLNFALELSVKTFEMEHAVARSRFLDLMW